MLQSSSASSHPSQRAVGSSLSSDPSLHPASDRPLAPKASVALAIDTATDHLACAAVGWEPERGLEGVTVLAAGDHPCRRQSNVELLPTCEKTLHEAGLTMDDVAVVLCGRGPGSFTGVRIGIATAKGLALSLLVPALGISTLDAVAWGAWRAGTRGLVGVVADAMRKEVYPGLYELDDTGAHRLFGVETVAKVPNAIAAWSERPDAATIQLVGDGLVKYRESYVQAGFGPVLDEELWHPTGEGLALAGAAPWNYDPTSSGDPALLLPVYTRLSDAEENELKRLGLPEPQSARQTGVFDALADRHLQLRPMGLADLSQVGLLEEAVYAGSEHAPWSSEIFATELADPNHPWWVAHDEGRVVGFAGGRLCGSDLELEEVVVEPARRREGIARRLVARVAYDGQTLGASSASLEVFADNAAALALYDALGFAETGRRRDYYGSGQDALIMSSALPLTGGDEVLVETSLPTRAWPPVLGTRTSEEAQALQAAGELVLAIETSCDETAMAVIAGGTVPEAARAIASAGEHSDKQSRDTHFASLNGTIIANVVASQIDFHARFGGVVPEIASRKHTEALVGVYEEAMEAAAQALGLKEPLRADELSAVAVTQGPGLVGALVVGVAFAKGLCAGASTKLIGVNHLEGHLLANLLVHPDLTPPFVASLVSGGHTMLVYVREWGTYEILGQTIDDAVGEAFDKVAKALGLGYPGGPIIARLAEEGDPKAIDFPRALLHSHELDFSLSGLKTAVVTYLESEARAGRPISAPNVAASFQQAVIDVQVAKALRAVEACGVDEFCLGGGVAANEALRHAYKEALSERGVRLTVPPLSACTDNAQMIALAGLRKLRGGEVATLAMDADPNLKF